MTYHRISEMRAKVGLLCYVAYRAQKLDHADVDVIDEYLSNHAEMSDETKDAYHRAVLEMFQSRTERWKELLLGALKESGGDDC